MCTEPPVIVFDGVCVLCSRWVDFILRHDHAGRFRLAAMQDACGRTLLHAHGLSPDPFSFLLVEDGHGYTDTAAIARVLGGLGGVWRVLGAMLLAMPAICRNPLYRYVARHRYRLFGQRTHCRLPDPTQCWRFLE